MNDTVKNIQAGVGVAATLLLAVIAFIWTQAAVDVWTFEQKIQAILNPALADACAQIMAEAIK